MQSLLKLERKDILSWLDLDDYHYEGGLCKQIESLWNSNYQTIQKLDFCQFYLQLRHHLFQLILTILLDPRNIISDINLYETGFNGPSSD